MLRRLLRHPSTFPIKTLTLAHPYCTHRRPRPNPITTPNPKRNPTRGRRQSPPAVSQSDLDAAISQLPSRFTTDDLSSLISRHPDPHLCFHLFSWATHQPRFRSDPSLFLSLIKKLGSARLLPELHSVASLALSTLPPSLPLFNTIIYFFAEARQLSKAVHVYTLMRRSPDPAHRPNIATFNLLFNALLSRGANSYINRFYMSTISCLFRQMLDSGVKPDLTALNFLVRGYVLSLHLNDALRVFHQFESEYGVEPDGNTYSYLVHGLCAQGRTRNAMELYGEARGKGMRLSVRAGNSLVSALAMGGEVDEAARVLWEVVKMGKAVEEITLRTAVEGLWRERGPKAAGELVRELWEREVMNARVCRELTNWIEDGCGCQHWNE